MKIVSREIVPLVYDKVRWKEKWKMRFIKFKTAIKAVLLFLTGRFYDSLDKFSDPGNYSAHILSLRESTSVKPKHPRDYQFEHELFNEQLKQEEVWTICVNFLKRISSTPRYDVFLFDTEPRIKGLHAELFTAFFYENDEEVFYQRIIPDELGATELIGIKKGTDTVIIYSQIKDFYLYKIDEKENCIIGFNVLKDQALKLFVEW